jgi:hypothetical protein
MAKHRKSPLLTFLLTLILTQCIFLPGTSLASYLTLAWDPNTEPELVGYRGYDGTAPRECVDSIDGGNITTHQLDHLLDAVTYFIAVTAHDTSGRESDFSHEVSGVGITDPKNAPPTADARPDQTVREGVMVVLDASNSSGPDGGIASYQWEQIAGNPLPLSDSTAPNPAFVGPFVDSSELFLFRVTGRDEGDLQASDEVSLAVKDTSFSGINPVEIGSKDPFTEWGYLIATAAYGSLWGWGPHVRALRDFRDHYLTKSQLGKSFIRDDYRYNPFIAQHIKANPSLKGATRMSLTPLVLLSQFLVRSTLTDKIVYLLFVLCYSLCIFRWLLKNHPDI